MKVYGENLIVNQQCGYVVQQAYLLLMAALFALNYKVGLFKAKKELLFNLTWMLASFLPFTVCPEPLLRTTALTSIAITIFINIYRKTRILILITYLILVVFIILTTLITIIG